ncbi:hypothetical protein KXX34_006237 [Aspergillus fumigatus]|nr:hypothetical protein KXX34_006237 [Aspergillus fumigatus]KAH2603497.1 hypothetical protein KXW93_007845 [Aspergillus fumigatus]
MDQIENISCQEVLGFNPDLLVAITLSAQAAGLTHHFPFTSWEESRLAHEPGPPEALSQRLLLILDDFRNFNRERAWRVLAFLLSRNSCISEAATTVLLEATFDSSYFNFITNPLDSALKQPSPEREHVLQTLADKYQHWLRPSPPPSSSIDTGFFTRIYWGAVGDMATEIQNLFNYAPISFLVHKWQLLRNTCQYACDQAQVAMLLHILDANTSPFVVTCLIDGMVRAGVEVPDKYSRFIGLRKTLEHRANSMPLNEDSPFEKSAIVTMERIVIIDDQPDYAGVFNDRGEFEYGGFGDEESDDIESVNGTGYDADSEDYAEFDDSDW